MPSDPSANAPCIVWFRQDFRLEDNPALSAAVKRGGPVIPIFIWSPEDEGRWRMGAASRWWLHYSLESLSKSLTALGAHLVIRDGSVASGLKELVEATGAEAVFWNRRWEPAAQKQEEAVQAMLKKQGVEGRAFNAALLFEPGEVLNGSGGPYKVFTPFYRACLAKGLPSRTQPAPEAIEGSRLKGLKLEDLELLPKIHWAGEIAKAWTPGEAGAQKQLDWFAHGPVADYMEERNRPDHEGVSRMSPHLHFGEIGPRQIVHRLRGDVAQGYLREVVWREFAHHMLHFYPETTDEPLHPEFVHFPWEKDVKGRHAWQKGLTGYPMVDAGMRQLWTTGWMHNRVRMIVASFLVKDLLIPWQSGAKWFWDTLVDADLANNTMGWQWTAGCGADAAPYFRIFNPVSQGEKFDPDGAYVREWVPELAKLPKEWIHKPWEAPAAVLETAGVSLGETYPKPIVDHKFARGRALQALARAKGSPHPDDPQPQLDL